MSKQIRIIPPDRVDKQQEELSPEEIKRRLLSIPDELANSQGWDEYLDKVNEKSSLIADPKLLQYIGALRAYEKKVPLIFYYLIYKLNGWDTSGNKLHNRPGIVGKWTNYLIYLRFPEGTLKELQARNRKTENGVRLFKHHQYLTLLGESHFQQFLQEAIDVMSQCQYWDQFIRRFAKKCGKGYQMDLFEDVDEK